MLYVEFQTGNLDILILNTYKIQVYPTIKY